MNEQENSVQQTSKWQTVLAVIKKYADRWFIQAFSGMAQGLFVTLIAGTIIKTIGTQIFGGTAFGNFLVLLAA